MVEHADRLMRRLLPSAALSIVLVPALALGFPGGDLAGFNPDPLIWGGQNVGTCGWPTTVHVSNGGSWCTGTLVHPRVVVYAAHCGAQSTRIRFGETYNTARVVDCQQSMVNPGWNGSQGTDWAFCVLDEEVPLPTTPVVYGCEENMLSNGQQVAIVGFGNNSGESGSGTKRWGMTSMWGLSWGGNTVNVGGGGEPTVCSGDSGGPIFVQYPDGSWHALGIASTKSSGTCDEAMGTHALITGAVPWIEQNSGYDITPCHDQDGSWNPGPGCGNFLTSGVNGSGSYSTWCQGTGALQYSSTCGPNFGEQTETNPPTVSIVDPADGTVFMDSEITMPIVLNVADDSGYIKQAQLEIDGMLLPEVDTVEPWQFSNVTFPTGVWTLRAYAWDFWDNEGVSAPVTIYVNTEPRADTGGAETTTTAGSDTGTTASTGATGTTGGNGDDGGADETGGLLPGNFGENPPETSGCACDVDREGTPLTGLFALGLLGLLRRPRP